MSEAPPILPEPCSCKTDRTCECRTCASAEETLIVTLHVTTIPKEYLATTKWLPLNHRRYVVTGTNLDKLKNDERISWQLSSSYHLM